MSTLFPFLYQTRTIQRAASKAPFVASTFRAFHASRIHGRRQGEEDSIPFEWDGQAAEESRHEADLGPRTVDRSTITPTEERAFRKIFTDIARRGHPSQGSFGATPRGTGWQAASRVRNTEDILKNYPAALRGSARAALGLPEEVESQESAEETLEEFSPESEEEMGRRQQQWEEQKALRDSAAEQMDELLNACKTDEEVGAVLEREVFSMVKKLGIEEGSVSRRFALADAEAAPRVAPAQEETGQEATIEASKLDMDSHGPLYSLHLLQGLRALDQDFSRPSPLALKVLPRIRELGMASYVLGASTPFYNELATIMWRRHGDIRSVITLLREMQFAGLTPDAQTLQLVHEIEGRLDAMSDGSEGPFAELLSSMPDFDFDIRAQLGVLANKLEPALRRQG